MTVRLKLTVDNVSKQSGSWGHLPGLRKCPAKEGRRGGERRGGEGRGREGRADEREEKERNMLVNVSGQQM